MVADLCVKGKKAPRQSAKILKSDLSAGRNAYPKVLWLPRFSMLIMCLQIRDEKSKESKLVKYQPSDLCFQQRQKLHLLLAVAFVSVYIPTFVRIHTQRGRQFCSFNVQKIFSWLFQSSTAPESQKLVRRVMVTHRKHRKVLEELAGQRCSALTPLLWVEWTDCSLVEEHVLMRSVSLLCEEWRWTCRWRESLSPGKVKEPGRLAGDAGMELQKEPFCKGLLGGKVSLPKGEGKVVERGEFIGEMAPGLGFPSVSDPMLFLDRLSSELPRKSFWAPSDEPEMFPAVFLGLSMTFILGICSASFWWPSGSAWGGCLSGWLRPVSKEVL